eukprot:scaffold1665_cov17-Tisochrysis_lutea.AAC.1
MHMWACNSHKNKCNSAVSDSNFHKGQLNLLKCKTSASTAALHSWKAPCHKHHDHPWIQIKTEVVRMKLAAANSSMASRGDSAFQLHETPPPLST